MLIMEFKQRSEKSDFSKSILNAFQFQTASLDLVTVISQSATIIRLSPQKTIIVSSGNYFLKYLNEEHKMSYTTLKKHQVKAALVNENCRFFIVNRNQQRMQQDYQLEDFKKVKLMRLFSIKDLETDLIDFMQRNTMDLEYQEMGWAKNFDLESLRASSFLVFQV